MRAVTNIQQFTELMAGAKFLVTVGKVGNWRYRAEKLLGEDAAKLPPVLYQVVTNRFRKLCTPQRSLELQELFKRNGFDLQSQTPHATCLDHRGIL